MHKTQNSGKEKYSPLKIVLVFLTILVFDQMTKYLFATRTITIIPKIADLTPTTNTGSAFGVLQWMPNTFYIILSAMILAVGLALLKKGKIPPMITILFMAGVAGNMIDRTIYGYVRDFITISIWPSFNIADSVMVISVVLFIIKTARSKEQNI
ncbi:signal peptidase II [Candidatus Woesearchaeota archaeon]|nr:signal peptidase II [Candidatus Woesearchaeota archaeon]